MPEISKETFPVHISDTQFEIKESTIADSHAPRSSFNKQLERGTLDLGEGFLMHEEPVIVDRAADGSIVRVTPVSEHRLFRSRDEDKIAAIDAPPRPSPVQLPRKQREQLVEILTTRLFKFYEAEGPDTPRFNPLFDGIPDLPSGSPEHLEPLPGTKLYPATRGQVYDWLRRFVAARTQVIEHKRNKAFKDDITNYTLRFKTD